MHCKEIVKIFKWHAFGDSGFIKKVLMVCFRLMKEMVVRIFWNIYGHIKTLKTLLPLFMDGVQLPQG